MNYDPGNIFAKILRGEIPCHKVYEDEAVLAFMDVMPQADGHTLVIPKVPSRNLLDADPAILGSLMAAVQKIDADFARSSDTHLIKLEIPCLAAAGIDLYLKDESTHPSGSLKHFCVVRENFRWSQPRLERGVGRPGCLFAITAHAPAGSLIAADSARSLRR